MAISGLGGRRPPDEGTTVVRVGMPDTPYIRVYAVLMAGHREPEGGG